MVVRSGSVPDDLVLVQCEGVEVAYDADLVLKGVDLRIARGEIVSIMGTSGSGKSTLLLSLAGLLPPATGRVEVAGTSLYELDPDARTEFRREHIGLVFQFGQLVGELTIKDNVALPLLLGGATRPDAAARAEHLLTQVGLDGLAGRYPSQLSGGQRQRVAVARAMVTGPQVVLADEPTGSLDEAASGTVLQLLCGTVRQARAALVLVTHDTAVAALADRQLHLVDGVLAEALGKVS